MPKFTELPGASPPGPPPGLCSPPDPQLFFWSLWPRHYQNASDGPVIYGISPMARPSLVVQVRCSAGACKVINLLYLKLTM